MLAGEGNNEGKALHFATDSYQQFIILQMKPFFSERRLSPPAPLPPEAPLSDTLPRMGCERAFLCQPCSCIFPRITESMREALPALAVLSINKTHQYKEDFIKDSFTASAMYTFSHLALEGHHCYLEPGKQITVFPQKTCNG